MDVKVICGAEIGTDHRLLIVEMRFKRYKKERFKKFEKIQVKELTKPEKKKEYTALIETKLGELEINEDTELDDMWQIFKKAVIESAIEI
jgi:hypothetical protein